jgi:hypothetical protein
MSMALVISKRAPGLEGVAADHVIERVLEHAVLGEHLCQQRATPGRVWP